jgi:hypothetical protein
MAQVKILKIGSTGLPSEIDTSADDVTANSFTVNGGLVASSSGIDMNNSNLSDVDTISFTDPASDGLTVTAGTLIADNIMGEAFENSMSVGAAVIFPSVSDDADELDALGIPYLSGAPSASPTDSGRFLVYDDSNNKLYIWDGAAWDDLSSVSAANSLEDSYTADEALTANDAVYISAADNVSKADNDAGSGASHVIGFAKSTVSDTDPVVVQKAGVMSGFSSLTAGDRYFLSNTAGAISNSVPTGSGAVIVQVGYAKNTTDLDIMIQQLGKRA